MTHLTTHQILTGLLKKANNLPIVLTFEPQLSNLGVWEAPEEQDTPHRHSVDPFVCHPSVADSHSGATVQCARISAMIKNQIPPTITLITFVYVIIVSILASERNRDETRTQGATEWKLMNFCAQCKLGVMQHLS